jgi:hypothetical protein
MFTIALLFGWVDVLYFLARWLVLYKIAGKQ